MKLYIFRHKTLVGLSILFLCFCCCLAILPEQTEFNFNVHELGDDNFNSTIESTENIFIFIWTIFYTDKPAALKFYEDFSEAWNIVKNYEDDIPVQFAVVNCSVSTRACAKFSGSRAPLTASVNLYKNYGKERIRFGPYSGPLARGYTQYILQFLRRNTCPTILKEIKDIKEYEKFVQNPMGGVLSFLPEGGKFDKTYFEITPFYNEKQPNRPAITMPFGFSRSEEIRLFAKADQITTHLYRREEFRNTFESNYSVFDNPWYGEDIAAFLVNEYSGLIRVRLQELESRDFPSQRPLLNIYVPEDEQNRDSKTAILNIWNKVLPLATKYKNNLTFTLSPISIGFPGGYFNELKMVFNIEEKDRNTNRIYVTALNEVKTKFIMDESFSVEELEKFIKSFLQNELVPFIKSAPIPNPQTSPILTVVGDNFHNLIWENVEDTILILYKNSYAKKRLRLDALASKLNGEKILFGEMNAEENDIPSELNFEFKTEHERPNCVVFFIPSKNKTEIQKLNEVCRSEDDILRLAAKYAEEELNGYDRNGNKKVVPTLNPNNCKCSCPNPNMV